MALAGLWADVTAADGTTSRRMVLITTAAQGPAAAAHQRMPVSVPRERWDAWLREGDVSTFEGCGERWGAPELAEQKVQSSFDFG